MNKIINKMSWIERKKKIESDPRCPRNRWLYRPDCCDRAKRDSCGAADAAAAAAGVCVPCACAFRLPLPEAFWDCDASIRRRRWWAVWRPNPAASAAPPPTILAIPYCCNHLLITFNYIQLHSIQFNSSSLYCISFNSIWFNCISFNSI